MQKNNRIFLIGALVIVVITIAVAVTLNFNLISTTVIGPRALTGNVTGTVFGDTNFNGLKETTETGISGVQVSVYAPGVTAPLTATTNATGTYTVANVPNGTARIEFSTPVGYESTKGSAVVPTGTTSITKSLTSVAFVSTPGSNFDYGLTLPSKFCQADPIIGMPCNINGDPVHGTSGNQAGFYAVPYGAKTDPPTETKKVVKASDIGATWGNAYQKTSNKFFTSALVKRHSGLGPLGIGGIYAITNAAGDGATVEQFVDVTKSPLNIRVDSATDPLKRSAAPCDPRTDANCLPANFDPAKPIASQASYDIDAYGKTGKIGIGGLDLSDDEKEVWFMNLFDKKVYAISIATKTVLHSYQIPNPGCTEAGNDYRPWAVKYNAGLVYVGIACSGFGNNQGLKAYVKSVNPSTGAIADVLGPVDLSFPRGVVGNNIPIKWNKWIDNPADLPNAQSWDDHNFISYPQPILSDIEFGANNRGMALGFLDRFGNQSGYLNFAPFFPHHDGPDTIWTGKSGRSSGDMLIACMDGSNVFQLEKNGSVCGVTTNGKDDGQGPLDDQTPPKGGEYYLSEWGWGYVNGPYACNISDDTKDGNPDGTCHDLIPSTGQFCTDPRGCGSAFGHDEASLGAIAFNPNTKELVAPIFDLLNPTRLPTGGARTFSTGLSWINGVTGSDGSTVNPKNPNRTHAYELFTTGIDSGTFGKSNGIGDVELACQAAPVEIGNRVWNDTNYNGLQDADEAGIEGVVVKLYKDNVEVGSFTTGEDNANISSKPGEFFFNDSNVSGGLKPNTSYELRIEAGNFDAGKPLNGFGITLQNTNPALDHIDSDGTFVSQHVYKIALTTGGPGQNNHTYDFGFLPPASIGDFVWNDKGTGIAGQENTARNGIQDANEPGIANVKVKLWSSGATGDIFEKDTLTDANGLYKFTDLPPGVYFLEFTDIPAGFVFSPKDAGGTGNNDAKDSDADITTHKTIQTELKPGENDLTWDAGLNQPVVQKYTIGNRVWIDNDNDGIQDAGEPGAPGVNVQLLKNGAFTGREISTDAQGLYKFDQLDAGNYSVRFPTLRSGAYINYQLAKHNVGNNAGTADEVDDDVELLLLGQNGGTTKEFDLPNTYSNAHANVDDTWDAGIVPPAPVIKYSIGNFVWNDTTRNDRQDSGEAGIANAKVELLNATTNAVIGTAQLTPGTGLYRFDNLDQGSYKVRFTKPTGTAFIFAKKGTTIADNIDSDADENTGITDVIELPNARSNANNNLDDTWDAGMYEPVVQTNTASLGDFVWDDLNENGIQEANEPGISNVQIELLKGGVVIAPGRTGTDGKYLFRGLVPGSDYAVKFPDIPNFVRTAKNAGTPNNDTNDSDADLTTGTTTELIDLQAGETDITWDAGYHKPPVVQQPASIGDFVWEDMNANGIQDEGELGINDVQVELYSDDTHSLVDTTRTFRGPANADRANSHDGYYEFTNLTPGIYYLRFEKKSGYEFTLQNATRPNDRRRDDIDSDANQATGVTAITNLDPGENDPTWDAGLYRPAAIGDFVWDDTNQNGIQDLNEPGIDGLIVKLINKSTELVVQTMTTATKNGVKGSYLFSGLMPGDYTVEFTTQAGYSFSAQDQGSDNAKDSDVNLQTGRTEVINLVSNETDLTWDAGMFKPPVPPVPAIIGDFVWNDANQNGIQDSGELGLPNVTVKLSPCIGNVPGNIQSITTTDVNGLYRFINLAAGSYSLEFVTLGGYSLSPKDAGSDDAKDSDPDLKTGKTICTTLDAGETDLTWDAGMSQVAIQQEPLPAIIGDFVWNDANQNGIQDQNENGIQGVTVQLSPCVGNVIATTRTGEGGKYSFSNLKPGSYKIKFVVPNGYRFTEINKGTNFALDSDADQTTGQAICTTLDAGETDLRWDAGLIKIPQQVSTPPTQKPVTPPSAVLPITGASVYWLIASGGLVLIGIIFIGSGMAIKRRGGNSEDDDISDDQDTSNLKNPRTY